MANSLTQAEYDIPVELISLRPPVTPEKFEEFCRKYDELRLELTSTGELIIMPPAGAQTSSINSNLNYQLEAWSIQDGSGVCFDSSAGFTLPNGAVRSPDAAWIHLQQWDILTKQQKSSFPPICPDFVVELRSPSDNLTQLNLKMIEYLENGTDLGWLIDPFRRKVYVYMPGQETVVLDNAVSVSGHPLLPGFRLQLARLWYDE